MYAVSARARHGCPFVVLVVTPDPATARWASKPVDLGGGTRRSLVVGPEGIPVITDVELAAREPHLAVLSALAAQRLAARFARPPGAPSALATTPARPRPHYRSTGEPNAKPCPSPCLGERGLARLIDMR
jgi:hypothetical protein